MVDVEISYYHDTNVLGNMLLEKKFKLDNGCFTRAWWSVPIAKQQGTTCGMDRTQLNFGINTYAQGNYKFNVFPHKNKNATVTVFAISAADGLIPGNAQTRNAIVQPCLLKTHNQRS